MTCKYRYVATIMVAFCFVWTCNADVRAQGGQVPPPVQLPLGLLKDKRVVEFDRMIDSWNSGDLVLPPKTVVAARLDARLAARVEKKLYTYETSDWRGRLMSQLDKLPDKVAPGADVTASGAQVLRLLLVKNLTSVNTDIKTDLEVSLFLILGSASQSGRDTIDADVMLNNVVTWWTGIWPFCE